MRPFVATCLPLLTEDCEADVHRSAGQNDRDHTPVEKRSAVQSGAVRCSEVQCSEVKCSAVK